MKKPLRRKQDIGGGFVPSRRNTARGDADSRAWGVHGPVKGLAVQREVHREVEHAIGKFPCHTCRSGPAVSGSNVCYRPNEREIFLLMIALDKT
jgi:hypothetical protein